MENCNYLDHPSPKNSNLKKLINLCPKIPAPLICPSCHQSRHNSDPRSTQRDLLSTVYSPVGQMERTDSEQIENHLVASQTASGLSTWSGKLASLSVLGPEAAEAAVRVAREKSNFDLGFPKTPEGKCDRQGQSVSSFGPDKGQSSGAVRLSHGASRRHTRSLTLSHALGVIL